MQGSGKQEKAKESVITEARSECDCCSSLSSPIDRHINSHTPSMALLLEYSSQLSPPLQLAAGFLPFFLFAIAVPSSSFFFFFFYRSSPLSAPGFLCISNLYPSLSPAFVPSYLFSHISLPLSVAEILSQGLNSNFGTKTASFQILKSLRPVISMVNFSKMSDKLHHLLI